MRSRVLPMITFVVSLFGFSQAAFAGSQEQGRNPAITCEKLGSMKLKDVSSITAQPVAAGAFTPTGSAALTNLPAFAACRSLSSRRST
jgi:hypothetical protein